MSAATFERDFSRVKNPSFALLHQIAAAIAYFRKRYCYPSQEELRQRVARHCGWRVSLRTLNRHLRALEEDGYITRLRRHRHVKGKGMEMHSTLYTLTAKAWRWLSKIFQAAQDAVSWGVKRVTHSAEYNPSRENNTAAGPTGAARQEIRTPPDGGGGNKKQSPLELQRQINATKPTTTGLSTLQFLKRSLNRERR